MHFKGKNGACDACGGGRKKNGGVKGERLLKEFSGVRISHFGGKELIYNALISCHFTLNDL